jgi:hypothetical protein
MAANPIAVTTTEDVSLERVRDLLCNAFEGGSNYWYVIVDYHRPADETKLYRGTDELPFPHLDYPVSEGGHLMISTHMGDEFLGQTKWPLSLVTIRKGLEVMRQKYPQHWHDFIVENDDATTGDVFLQCCLFEETVYG